MSQPGYWSKYKEIFLEEWESDFKSIATLTYIIKNI